MKWMLTGLCWLRRACFLRPEPNVTLNSAHSVFLGPGHGDRTRNWKMVSVRGFMERLQAPERTGAAGQQPLLQRTGGQPVCPGSPEPRCLCSASGPAVAREHPAGTSESDLG